MPIKKLTGQIAAAWVTAVVAFAQSPCPSASNVAGKPRSPLPPPTGRYKVGRTTYHIITRPAPKPLGAVIPESELMAYIWYPADATSSAQNAPYIPAYVTAAKAASESVRDLLGLSYCAFEQGRLVSYAIENVPLSTAERRYPLLLFEPGLDMTSLAYSAQLEDLASHGYVVVAVDHTPSAQFVVFPNGRVVLFDRKKWDVIFEDRLKEGSKERAEWEKAQDEAGAASLRAVLDDLTRAGDARPLLAGRIDQKRIGVFGHSFGGMAALIALAQERRFHAGLDQDGTDSGISAFAKEAPRNGQGFFGLFFRPPSGNGRPHADSLFAALPPGTTRATIAAAVRFVHMSYSDVPLLSSGDAAGRANGLRNLAVIRATTRRFFDKNFGRTAASIQSLTSEGFPEINVNISAH